MQLEVVVLYLDIYFDQVGMSQYNTVWTDLYGLLTTGSQTAAKSTKG